MHERSRALSPSPHHAHPLENVDDDDDDPSDTGDPKLWDPYAGLKPLQLDGCASDDEVALVGKLPYGVNKSLTCLIIEGNDFLQYLLPKNLNIVLIY